MVILPYVVEVDAELFKETTKKVRGDRDKVTGKINSACKSLVAVIKSQEVFFWVHDIVSVFI